LKQFGKEISLPSFSSSVLSTFFSINNSRQGYFHETIGQIPKFSYQDFRTEESLKQTMNMNHSVSSIGEAKINSSGSVLISPQKTGRRGVQGAHVSR
jgi:hypothetical protein